jgi:hypothetical protein
MKEAAKWYKLAAKQEHANAQFFLGGCYANGNGVAWTWIEWMSENKSKRCFAILVLSLRESRLLAVRFRLSLCFLHPEMPSRVSLSCCSSPRLFLPLFRQRSICSASCSILYPPLSTENEPQGSNREER